MCHEKGTQHQHVFNARKKTGGWYSRRFGKNPRWANPICDIARFEIVYEEELLPTIEVTWF